MTTHVVSVSGLSLEDFDYTHFYEKYVSQLIKENRNTCIYGGIDRNLNDGANPVPVNVFTFEASI